MKKTLLTAALILASATAPFAQQAAKRTELSAPIVVLTPVVAKNADALNLTEAQRADLQNWIATMPAKRKAVEADAITARAALRDAIVSGAPQTEREELAATVGAFETQLVLMRSACTDYWRATLTKDQFAQLLAIANYTVN